MIFSAGSRKGSAQLTVAQRPAKGGDSAHNPKHQERKPGLNIEELKPEAGENAGTDNVCNDNSAGSRETDCGRWFRRIRSGHLRRFVHCRVDNGICLSKWRIG